VADESAQPASAGAVGVLDSGVGGLSVLRQLRDLLPAESMEYVADQAHVPYAPRQADEVRRFSTGITRFLLARRAKLIVLACNTASVAALGHLLRTFPGTPFVGMDPAIKPAAAGTRTGKIGVLATTGTFRSERYAHLLHEFARGVEVVMCPCPGLVELIEGGQLDTPEAAAALRSFIEPMLRQGVDSLVLGCTHFPLAMAQIQAVDGPTVRLIDPSPAVARQARHLLAERGLLLPESAPPGQVRLFTTGLQTTRLKQMAAGLLGSAAAPVQALRWTNAESLVSA
jgi:glutamate racemase